MTVGAAAHRGEAGFTLIELLVSTTLLSLVLLLLFGGLRFGVRAWDGAQAHGVRMDELRVVQDLLRREIERAYPYYDSTDPVHPAVDFAGGADRLTFLAPTPQAAESAGRARITILAERQGAEMLLAMQAAPELGASSSGAWSAPLLRNIAAVQFSYFGDHGWQTGWTKAGAMPSLVRLHVAFRAGDGRVWPDLLVAPRIGTDAGCVYDYSTKHCRGRP